MVSVISCEVTDIGMTEVRWVVLVAVDGLGLGIAKSPLSGDSVFRILSGMLSLPGNRRGEGYMHAFLLTSLATLQRILGVDQRQQPVTRVTGHHPST